MFNILMVNRMHELLLSLNGAHGSGPSKGWTEIKAAGGPSARQGMSIATYGRSIYVYGGRLDDTDIFTDELYSFNTLTNTWAKLRSSSVPTDLHRMVVVGKKIYVWGGTNGTTEFKTMRVYDIVANTWSTIASPPAGTVGALNVLMVTVDSAIYMVGGMDDAQPDGYTGMVKLETYPNPVWSTLTSHPVPIQNGNIAVYDDMIYTSHGNSSRGIVINDRIRQYDIYNNAAGWVDKALIPTTNATSRVAGTAVTDGKNIFYMGGTTQTDIIESYNAYTNVYTVDTGFKMVPNRDYARGWTSVNKQYFFGGTNNELWVLDLNVGKPPRSFVVIPHQEFTAGYDTAISTQQGTKVNVGCNWLRLTDTNGRIFVTPQKILRRSSPLNDQNASGPAGWSWSIQLPSSTAIVASVWDGFYSSLTDSFPSINPTVFPKIGNYRQITMGFGSLGGYMWCVWSGAEDVNARGGPTYGGTTTFGRAQVSTSACWKTIFQLNSGVFPW